MFHTTGVVNKYNAEVWSQENPHAVGRVPQISQQIVIWGSMHEKKLVNRYFLSEPAVASGNYKTELLVYVRPKLLDLPAPPISQKDGAL